VNDHGSFDYEPRSDHQADGEETHKKSAPYRQPKKVTNYCLPLVLNP